MSALSSRPDHAVRLGRYQLLTELGRGGMAELHLGRVHGAGGFAKVVAIKRIHPHHGRDARFVEMFLNEGRIAAQLAHPNVCQVHDLGEVDGELFLVMEYLEGVSWEEAMAALPRAGDGSDLRFIVGAFAQLCEGLHYAHTLRAPDGRATPVVHRDVSPQNLFITTAGVAKVLDFGVSKVLTEDRVTRSGVVKGKLTYMPPEQLADQPLDARVDVFAAGTVLWEAITRARLFKRETDYLVWKAITEEPIPPPSAHRPELPPALDAVLARALARDRDARYASTIELARALRAATIGLGPPLDQAELGEAVRRHCATTLATRAAQVSVALTEPSGDPDPDAAATLRMPTGPGTEATKPSRPRVIAPTASVALRDASVASATPALRPARRGVAALVIVGALIAAAGAVAVAVRGCGGAPRGGAAPGAAVASLDAGGAVDAGVAVAAAVDAGVAVAAAVDAGVAVAAAVDAGVAVAAAPRPAGSLTIDSDPYATIYLDGRRLGDTPLFRQPVSAGRHRVRAVRADGAARTFTITIAPAKELSYGQIAW
ncbi:MAG: serine/threonine protein kinase [Myxococcales bacterium]|nr:serine/threonine protein kinase [Myxococcales bacterium]